MNITGWYESENGAVLVDEDGNDYSMAAMIWAETLAKGGE